jgi:hypothetical protein
MSAILEAFTTIHGVLFLASALFDVWVWATQGFRLPRYVHTMALVTVVIGIWLWRIMPDDAPAREWGIFGPLFAIFVLPALVYGSFVALGGARAAADD